MPSLQKLAKEVNVTCVNITFGMGAAIDELRCLHFCRMENDARAYW